MAEIKRKGSRTINAIPPEILEALNSGTIETANLVEWLALDQMVLLENLLAKTGRMRYYEPAARDVAMLKKQTVTALTAAIGASLYEQGVLYGDSALTELMAGHPSDMVRCWATYAVGKNHGLTIREVFSSIRRFAADRHFGVREICWMAIRSRIAGQLEPSIDVLAEWTASPDENIRRFATESTRPRGVWCEHIERLKKNPELGLPLLEPLRNDPARYVQDSVGNWLNDAAKTRPDFVREVCRRWQTERNAKATEYIVRKAMRTLVRAGT